MTEQTTTAEPAAAPEPENNGFEWALVEIFGHRSHRGRAREEEKFGSKMLRIDEPELQPDGSVKWTSHYYGGSSIFSFTPTDETTVMRYARRAASVPAIPYQAPEPETLDDNNEYDDQD